MANYPSAQRRTTCRVISLACVLIGQAAHSVLADTVTWAIDGNGTWTVASNWSSNPALPGPADDVVIDRAAGTYTVTVPSTVQSVNSLASQENLTVLNGTLGVTTTAQIGGTLTLSGSTLDGGTWDFAEPSGTLATTENLVKSKLRGVTLSGVVSLSVGDTLIVENGLTLAPGTSVRFSSGNSSLSFAGSQTLAGAGEIVFTGSPSGGALGSSGSLTIAPGITVRTGTRDGFVILGNAGVNQGTLKAQASKTLTVNGNWTNAGVLAAEGGGTLTLAGSWSNTGTIEVASGGTVNLGGSFTPTSLGTVVTDGTPLLITGSLNASGTPLTLSASTPLFVLSGGTITGTITSADSTPLVARKDVTGRSNLLAAATVNTPITVPTGVGLTASGSIFNQPVTVTGGLALTGVWGNNGSITVTSGGGVSLGGTPPPAVGNITVADGTLGIASLGYTTAGIRPVSLSNATVVLSAQGVLDNTGDSLSLSPSTATLSLAGGTLKGGTVTGPAGTPVVFTSTVTPFGTLDGVTLAADAYVAPLTNLSVVNGLTLDHALVSLHAGHSSKPNVVSAATLSLAGAQAIAGTGIISFDGDSGVGYVKSSAGLTIGPGITVRTGTVSGFVGNSGFPLVLNGTVSAETPGTSVILFGSPVMNAGMLVATNNASLQIAGTSFTNTGTITVDSGASLTLNNGSVPNGTIRLAGPAFVQYYGHRSPATAVRGALATGRTGVTGIIDSAASSDPTRAIGYAEASDIVDFGTSDLATFADHTVDKYTLVLLPTLYGDANLDGVVNVDDYVRIDRGINLGLAGWVNGDFNYDGAVTAADYLLIDATFASQSPLSPEFLVQRESRFGANYVAQLLASVPEPSSSRAFWWLGRRLRRAEGGLAKADE